MTCWLPQCCACRWAEVASMRCPPPEAAELAPESPRGAEQTATANGPPAQASTPVHAEAPPSSLADASSLDAGGAVSSFLNSLLCSIERSCLHESSDKRPSTSSASDQKAPLPRGPARPVAAVPSGTSDSESGSDSEEGYRRWLNKRRRRGREQPDC